MRSQTLTIVKACYVECPDLRVKPPTARARACPGWSVGGGVVWSGIHQGAVREQVTYLSVAIVTELGAPGGVLAQDLQHWTEMC